MKKAATIRAVRSILFAVVLALFIASTSFAEPWSFGVISDTQWKTGTPDPVNCPLGDTKNCDGKSPNSVAVGIINALNQQLIDQGVKFVVAVGDVTDNGSKLALDTRVTFAQALYNAGIGFYPLRGNHESSQAGGIEFQRIFPQTQNGTNNLTPVDAFINNTVYGPVPVTGSAFTVGSNFTSYSDAYKGLFYSFDYDNTRFVLMDQFTPTDGVSHSNLDAAQVAWVDAQLSGKPAAGHAFVFGHKGFITENHADTLFGNDPSVNPVIAPNTAGLQDILIGSFDKNGVRYYMGGHDHMHNRAIVTSPDGTSEVQNIITASNSYKFYIPQIPSNDDKYDIPANGINNGPREKQIAQELFTIGYYIVTVDGPRVTVDFYSSPNGCNGDCDLVSMPANLTFTKRETFGYSLNGKEFRIAQGESYNTIKDSFEGTTARILSGTNGSKMVDLASRSLTKVVDTGWTEKPEDMPACRSHFKWSHFRHCRKPFAKSDDVVSNILTLWGMASNLGACDISNPNCVPSQTSNVQPVSVTEKTDTYTLSMSYDHKKCDFWRMGVGSFALATPDDEGNWVNAVDNNTGGTKKFVIGPWKSGYELGTYGVDPHTHTAWAVVNYEGDFAVVGNLHHASLHGN